MCWLADVLIDTCGEILVEVGISDVGIIVVANAMISLEFAVPVSCLITGMMVVVLVDVLPGVMAGVMIGIVTGIDIDALTMR